MRERQQSEVTRGFWYGQLGGEFKVAQVLCDLGDGKVHGPMEIIPQCTVKAPE